MSSPLTNLTHKQLFLTDCTIKNTEMLINNKDLISQVRKVLRLQKGDIIYVQNEWTRYEVEIKDRDDKTLKWAIKTQTKNEGNLTKKWMIIWMPNKREKVELIIQKLTEIGMDEIIFWPSERSVIKTWNENKSERLQKIAREAVEQSRWRVMPKIEFVTNISKNLKDKNVLVFDKNDDENPTKKITEFDYGIVGPEWWLTDRDYEILKWVNFEVRELGNTMMRTETAAIVGGWIVKNGK